jgi:hypothetical protein
VLIGTDASEVGRAVHDACSTGSARVLAFVGPPDDPSLTEMLAELATDPLETAGS